MDPGVLFLDLPSVMLGLAIIFLSLGSILAAAAAAGYLFIQFYKWRNREEHALEYVLLQVAVPRDNEIKIDAMEQLFASLYTLYRGKSNWLDFEFLKIQEHVAFEIVGKPGDIRFYVSVAQKHKDLIEKQVHGVYPGAVISEVEDYNIFTEKGRRFSLSWHRRITSGEVWGGNLFPRRRRTKPIRRRRSLMLTPRRWKQLKTRSASPDLARQSGLWPVRRVRRWPK